MLTTEQAVRVMHGAAVLKGLRVDYILRPELNKAANLAVWAVVNNRLDVLARVRAVLRETQAELTEAGMLDDLTVASALSGALELLLPVETGGKGCDDEDE